MPGPVPYTDIGGGGPNPPHGEDFFDRIVNVHWPKKIVGVVEQGLLVTDSNAKIAIALDTGESFSGVSSGATGKLLNEKPFTVLSSGIVVFGKPRDGAACFMACTDGTTIQRGIQDIGGDMEGIVWTPAYTADGLCALSFAGGGFFAVYQRSDAGRLDSSCAASFDGTNFSEIGNIYGGLPSLSDHDGLTPGSVAYNGSSYATVGEYSADPNYPYIISSDNQMAWANSTDGSGWSANCTRDEITNPGIRSQGISFAHSQLYTTIAGGAGRFVAVATARNVFQSHFPVPGTDGEEFIKYQRPTAAAAVSSDGDSWTTIKLPGAFEGHYADDVPISESVALSVAFVKTRSGTGYFIITANGIAASGASDQIPACWCWKGDGESWNMVTRQDGSAGFGTVSAIAQNLPATKIVYI